jgi:hypothetical protein
MAPRHLKDIIERATEAITGSVMARADSVHARETWRLWRALWREVGGKRTTDRIVTVCMYCERFHANTGEWAAAPPSLTEMLHDPKVVQLTHGVCPICLAGRLGDPESVSP